MAGLLGALALTAFAIMAGSGDAEAGREEPPPTGTEVPTSEPEPTGTETASEEADDRGTDESGATGTEAELGGGNPDLVVTKTSDTFDNVCGSDCSLREAVVEANRRTGNDTIILEGDTYVLTIPACTASCDQLDDETSGDLDIRSNVTIMGTNARQTIIDAQNITDAGGGTTGLDTRVIDTIGAGAIFVKLQDLTLQNGDSDDHGGGFSNRVGATTTLLRLTVKSNDTDGATTTGGGIFNEGEIDITRTTINGNTTSGMGGGIFNGGAGDIDMENVTVSGNSAPASDGGNLYNADAAAEMRLNNVTVANATSGDGITRFAGNVLLKNSLVVENTTRDCTEVTGNNAQTQGQNTDSDGTCDLSPSLGDTTDGGTIIQPLDNYGGPTNTHALVPGSSAIDSADNSDCASVDQREVPRPINGDNDPGAVCDRGAFELATCAGATATIIGTSGPDTINGTANIDVVLALGGGDTISTFGGNDVICAGDGNDTIRPGVGADDVHGGTGVDTLDYGAATARVVINLTTNTTAGPGSGPDDLEGIENGITGSGRDLLVGDAGANVLSAGSDRDFVYGRGGNDDLNGGSGLDVIYGGTGNDDMFGGSDGDRLYGNEGDDDLDGGDGNDRLVGGQDDDIMIGGEGNDRLIGFDGNDELNGGNGNDRISGQDGNDLLFGEAGDDSLDGGAGNDEIDGGTGVDLVTFNGAIAVDANLNSGVATGNGTDDLDNVEKLAGSSGSDTLIGDDLNNTLNGRGGNDLLIGNGGDDRLVGGPGGDDTVSFPGNTSVNVNLAAGTATGHGSDLLFGVENVIGSATGDTITGDGLANKLEGGDGADDIDGGGGPDEILAGDGIDDVIGGSGNDDIFGGEGDDALDGSGDNDDIFGEGGNDILDGGFGVDSCDGGTGSDFGINCEAQSNIP
ncbi:MAG: choice-of-anchor Q domain-containing protein [Dehalococcoidia bacterium]